MVAIPAVSYIAGDLHAFHWMDFGTAQAFIYCFGMVFPLFVMVMLDFHVPPLENRMFLSEVRLASLITLVLVER